MSQTFNSLAVNAFIAWRIAQVEHLLQTAEALVELDHYRHALNNFQSLADFVFDVSQELLVYGDQLENEKSRQEEDTEEVTDAEAARLFALAQKRRGKRLMFFNAPYGIKLRLHVHTHKQSQLPGCSARISHRCPFYLSC